MALAQSPGLNGIIRFGRYVQHPTVDVAYLVALEEGKNLAKAKICNLDTKSVVDVAKELRALATKLHKGEDEQFKKSQGPLQLLPTQLIRPLLKHWDEHYATQQERELARAENLRAGWVDERIDQSSRFTLPPMAMAR